jgi:hypothetical protein
MESKKFKYKFNFFLTDEEKELFFTLKKIHRLNNELGDDNIPFPVFVREMTNYYNNILLNSKK